MEKLIEEYLEKTGAWKMFINEEGLDKEDANLASVNVTSTNLIDDRCIFDANIIYDLVEEKGKQVDACGTVFLKDNIIISAK